MPRKGLQAVGADGRLDQELEEQFRAGAAQVVELIACAELLSSEPTAAEPTASQDPLHKLKLLARNLALTGMPSEVMQYKDRQSVTGAITWLSSARGGGGTSGARG